MHLSQLTTSMNGQSHSMAFVGEELEQCRSFGLWKGIFTLVLKIVPMLLIKNLIEFVKMTMMTMSSMGTVTKDISEQIGKLHLEPVSRPHGENQCQSRCTESLGFPEAAMESQKAAKTAPQQQHSLL